MQNQSSELLVPSLKELTKYCHDLQEILKNDKDVFASNDISNMEVSNKQKMELIEKINLIARDIRASGVNLAKQKEVQDVVSELKEEINECYGYIMLNSNMVYSNLARLKIVWDRLAACNLKMNCIYDHTGSLK